MSGDIAATVFFTIQERVSHRSTPSLGPYPFAGSYAHPTTQVIELATTVTDYPVRPLYAVNVPIDNG